MGGAVVGGAVVGGTVVVGAVVVGGIVVEVVVVDVVVATAVVVVLRRTPVVGAGLSPPPPQLHNTSSADATHPILFIPPPSPSGRRVAGAGFSAAGLRGSGRVETECVQRVGATCSGHGGEHGCGGSQR